MGRAVRKAQGCRDFAPPPDDSLLLDVDGLLYWRRMQIVAEVYPVP